MKARTSALIVFVAALFVLATASHGYLAQNETPRIGNLQHPVIVQHVGWSWLLISGLIGFLLGRLTNSRRRAHIRDEDIRRNRAA
jgi:uncharacterized membrane protein